VSALVLIDVNSSIATHLLLCCDGRIKLSDVVLTCVDKSDMKGSVPPVGTAGLVSAWLKKRPTSKSNGSTASQDWLILITHKKTLKKLRGQLASKHKQQPFMSCCTKQATGRSC